jgi:hypothetical protein
MSMNRLAKPALMAIMAMLFVARFPASAKPPDIASVPQNIPKAEQASLNQRSARLHAWHDELKTKAEGFNNRAVPKDSGGYAVYQRDKAKLDSEIATYTAAVTTFNGAVAKVSQKWGERLEAHIQRLQQQIASDQEAMRRQQKSIGQGQAELADWTNKNDEAQKDALKRAQDFLVDSLTAKLGEFGEGKLATLEANLEKRAPLGETWQRKIQKVQEFSSADARLSGAIDGIKLAGFTGAAADGWRKCKEWAAKNRKDEETLDAILAEWQRDPELKQILQESGINTFSGSLGFSKALAPWGTALDFGHFLVGYGYDATGWALSKKRIDQQIANRDQDLKAVDALKKQIERTMVELKACKLEQDQSVNRAQ